MVTFIYLTANQITYMRLLVSIFITILVALFTNPAFTQLKKDSLSIEQALSTYSVGAPVFSPDGSKAAVVVSQNGLGENMPASHIWVVDVASKTIRQFTNSQKSESSPKWSPNGKSLAFLSARNGDPQIYLLDMAGGEALQLTNAKTTISAFEWNPAGKTIAYVAEDTATAEEEKRKESNNDERVVGKATKASNIFTIDVATKQTKQLSARHWEINELKWVPSGEALLLATQQLPEAEIAQNQLVLLKVKDTTITKIPCPSHPFWGDINISPDGKSISYISAREDGPSPHDLFIQPIIGGPAKNTTAKSLDLPVLDTKFIDNHTTLASVEKGFFTRLYTITDNGKAVEFGINRNVGAFDVSANGTVIFQSGSGNQPQEVWLAGPDKAPVQVSHFNKAFDSIVLAQPKFLTYKSFDGLPIEGALLKPLTTNVKKLPLVVYIHGGPTSAFRDGYSPWVQLFVQKGYAVFCPNIRGSTGYGWNFLTANRNDWGGNDFKDVMAGVDYLIANENIDSARMGVSGWSYGGYMAEWAITQTNRFKASVSGAGMADLASEFGTEDNAAYDRWFWGTPYEHLENFYKHSPITYLKHAKTPTLIIQGEDDPIDPIGQSQELYRGLRYYNVPTELVLYPGEPHGFRKIKHVINYYTRMLAWFDKYVQ